jgi:hypothetical protein
LLPVDELVFAAIPGLEVGALWIASHGGDDGDLVGEESNRTAMLLSPVPGSNQVADAAEGGAAGASTPTLALQLRQLAPAAAPFVVSLQEAMERNLQLQLEPSHWAPPHSHGAAANHPGLVTTVSSLSNPGSLTPAVALKQEMLEHRLLSSMLGTPAAVGRPSQTSAAAASARTLVEAFSHSSVPLPADLRRELTRDRVAVIEALQVWLRHGGWHHRAPLSLPATGTEEALRRYVEAKRQQTRLDLMTVAFLYARPDAGL